MNTYVKWMEPKYSENENKHPSPLLFSAISLFQNKVQSASYDLHGYWKYAENKVIIERYSNSCQHSLALMFSYRWCL